MPREIRRFGDYELLEEIARGGMGVVYRARQIKLNRPVALKMILSGSFASKDFVQRFHTEAEAAARLDHPHIVPIYEIGEHEGQHFFSMKLIDGFSLADELQGKPWPPTRAAGLIAKMARAVHYAHQRGILHRDLKPGNILLDGKGEPHVSDFGLAKITESETNVTQTNAVMGSPTYMSPEQAAGQTKHLTTASDVYSLGAVLYELLTGRTPFQGESALEIMEQVVRREPIPPRMIQTHIDRDLETICLKCLEKEPVHRYTSADALADDLERWLRNEPILARPSGTVTHIYKWVHRKPAIASLAAATALSLIVIAIGSPVALFRINREREQVKMTAQRLRQSAYAADMKIASVALGEKNRGHALELVRKYLPKPAGEDLRGLDWRYLWMLLRSDELDTIRGHDGIVRDVTFSPDGKLLASVSLDETVRVWELRSKKIVATFTGMVGDGLQHSVAFAPDGKSLAAVRHGKIALWETRGWQLERELGNAEEPVVFSPDGKRLAACFGNGVKLWDTATWQTSFLPTGLSAGLFASLSISSDNSLLAVSHAYRSLQLWSLQTQTKLRDFEAVDQKCHAFSPTANRLAIGDWEGMVRVLDVDSNQFIATNQAHSATVLGLAFSPDGKLLATASADQLVQLYDASTLTKVATLKGHLNEVNAVAYSPDARTLASASKDGTVKLWSADPAAHTNSFEVSSAIKFVFFGENHSPLCSATTNGLLQFWNVADTKLTPSFALNIDPSDPDRFLASVRCSPDLSHAGYGTRDGRIQIYDCASGKNIKTLSVGDGAVRVGAISPDNRLLLVSKDKDRSRSLWNLQTAHIEAVLPDAYFYTGLPFTFTLDTFSPDGRLLAYEAQGYRVNLWDVVAKRVRWTLKGHSWGIYAMNFSPDGKLLATSSLDGDARVWDVATGKQVAPTLTGHHRGVRSTWFTSDSRTLVTASDDNTVRFWNLATGRETVTIKDAYPVLLSPDGNTLVLGRRNGASLVRIRTLAEIDELEKAKEKSP